MQFCKTALDNDIYYAMFFIKIGQLYLMQKKKSGDIGAFARGLQIDKWNKYILKEWNVLEFRRKPVIPFLPRENKLNIMLGKWTWKYSKKNDKK